MEEIPAVAKSIYVFCKKCDCDRYHKVLAHTGPRSAKIQCEVCGSRKSYSLPSAQPRTKSSVAKAERTAAASRAAQSKAAELHEAAYRELSDRLNIPAVKYSIKGDFTKDTVLDHPQFGKGFVVAASDQKIDVVFSTSVKSLVHRRP